MSVHYASDYSVLMALVDFIPVIFFFLSGNLMIDNYYRRLTKFNDVLLSSGVVMVFFAGLFKAIWKLIAALGICDFGPLNIMFLPVQAIGFVLIGVALLSLTIRRNYLLSVAPLPYFSGSIIFLASMIVGEILIIYSLVRQAFKQHNLLSAALLLVSFIASMSMGAMGSLEKLFTTSTINWIEEGINCLSQFCLFAGIYIQNYDVKKPLK